MENPIPKDSVVESDHESESGVINGTPPDLLEVANNATQNLLPAKSSEKYKKVYAKFKEYLIDKKANVSENVLLSYFHTLSETYHYKAPTLWSHYSMLRTTLKLFDDVNIETFFKLKAYLKRKNVGYEKKTSQILSHENVETFLNNAPNDTYLLEKVALIFGILGALRIDELVHVRVQDIEKHGDLMLVKIPFTKTHVAKSFTITQEYCEIIQKYINLRPTDTRISHDRFFTQYRNKKRTIQPVGKNSLSAIPQTIARYLNLPEAHRYTGHCFRRTSSSLLANAGADIDTLKRHGKWKSDAIAESYVESSLEYKKKTSNMISSSINLKRSHTSQNQEESVPVMKAYENLNQADRPISIEFVEETNTIDRNSNTTSTSSTCNTNKKPGTSGINFKKFKFQPKKPFFPASYYKNVQNSSTVESSILSYGYEPQRENSCNTTTGTDSRDSPLLGSPSTENIVLSQSSCVSQYIIEDYEPLQPQQASEPKPSTTSTDVFTISALPTQNSPYFNFNNCQITINMK